MKFLALADSQFGATTVTLESQEQAWDSIVTVAIERKVDGVLHAGDLFEHAIVEGQVLAAFRRPLARLRDAGIPMIVIRGNHDGAVRPVDALDVFHEYDLLRVSQRPEVIDFAGAFVVTLPWVSPKHLVAASNGASRDHLYEHASSMLVEIARELMEAECIYQNPERPKILLLHWSVSGASLPTGLRTDDLREVVLPWPDLDAIGYDAIIGAHIHQPQQLSDPRLDKTLGFVVGSPQQLNHGEHGDHGCWILEVGDHGHTDDRNVHAEFIPIPSPKFETVDFDDEWLDLIARDLDGIVWTPGQGDTTRVRYTATREQDAKIDKDALRRALLAAGAARVTIEPTIIREARARAENLTESLTELDALAAYCDEQGVQAVMRDRMFARTAEWLA